jgi:hypothetical protein
MEKTDGHSGPRNDIQRDEKAKTLQQLKELRRTRILETFVAIARAGGEA